MICLASVSLSSTSLTNPTPLTVPCLPAQSETHLLQLLLSPPTLSAIVPQPPEPPAHVHADVIVPDRELDSEEQQCRMQVGLGRCCGSGRGLDVCGF